jgi:transcriptional regulator with XRE-family HTH domain
MALAELVAKRRAELGLSLRQAADRSDGLVSHGRIGDIENGNDGDVSDRILEGLHLALDIPIRKLRAAAGLANPTARPFVLPDRANRLTQRERKLVLELVEVLLMAHRGS